MKNFNNLSKSFEGKLKTSTSNLKIRQKSLNNNKTPLKIPSKDYHSPFTKVNSIILTPLLKIESLRSYMKPLK